MVTLAEEFLFDSLNLVNKGTYFIVMNMKLLIRITKIMVAIVQWSHRSEVESVK